MHQLDGRSLRYDEIAQHAAVAEELELSPEAQERVSASHRYAQEVAATRPIYGRSTGVGANRDVPVATSAAELIQHAARLLRSHATSAGPERSRRRVRAMLVVRLNQLAAGGSGATPELVTDLLRLLNDDSLPTVYEFGSIGTGDLSALATVALSMMGELPCTPPLSRVSSFTASDALPFLSSNAATIGDAALALTDLAEAADAALLTAGLTFTACSGNAEAFSPAAAAATPFAGAGRVCRVMTSLLEDASAPRRIQDPFGLRTLPQVHGALLDALGRLRTVIEAMANVASENPVFIEGIGVAHHGGFHGAYLAQAVDGMLAALTQSARLSLNRLTMLSEPALTGLEPFLSSGEAGSSGVMITEYVAASALSRLRSLNAPNALHSVSLSRGVEDDASFAATSASNALQAVEAYRVILACETVAAVRAIRLGRLSCAPRVARALEQLEQQTGLSAEVADRNLTPDIAAAGAALPELAGLIRQLAP